MAHKTSKPGISHDYYPNTPITKEIQAGDLPGGGTLSNGNNKEEAQETPQTDKTTKGKAPSRLDGLPSFSLNPDAPTFTPQGSPVDSDKASVNERMEEPKDPSHRHNNGPFPFGYIGSANPFPPFLAATAPILEYGGLSGLFGYQLPHLHTAGSPSMYPYTALSRTQEQRRQPKTRTKTNNNKRQYRQSYATFRVTGLRCGQHTRPLMTPISGKNRLDEVRLNFANCQSESQYTDQGAEIFSDSVTVTLDRQTRLMVIPVTKSTRVTINRQQGQMFILPGEDPCRSIRYYTRQSAIRQWSATDYKDFFKGKLVKPSSINEVGLTVKFSTNFTPPGKDHFPWAYKHPRWMRGDFSYIYVQSVFREPNVLQVLDPSHPRTLEEFLNLWKQEGKPGSLEQRDCAVFTLLHSPSWMMHFALSVLAPEDFPVPQNMAIDADEAGLSGLGDQISQYGRIPALQSPGVHQMIWELARIMDRGTFTTVMANAVWPVAESVRWPAMDRLFNDMVSGVGDPMIRDCWRNYSGPRTF